MYYSESSILKIIYDIISLKFFLDNYLTCSFICMILLYVYMNYLIETKFEKNITIKEKYIYRGNRTNFIVVDTDNKHYIVSDSIQYWQFYSRELWTSLKIGETYTVDGYGKRFSFLCVDVFPHISLATEKTKFS
jgi:hypothetical protein